MSDLISKLEERVNTAMGVFPHPEAVKAAAFVVQQVKEIQQELAEERVTTERAAEITDWNAATLQAHARAVLAGQEASREWKGLQVERLGNGYVFVLSSIPRKMKAAG